MANVIASRYELIKKIGAGGMADVYLALDTVLDRTVAIKILKSDMSSDEVSLERFNREAHASTKLSHPNIVDIYDVGDQGNYHYIVMEYVKGYTLKQLLKKRGAIPPREAVWMMKQLTSALLEAHKNGLIHRDIKSQNVLIKDDGTIKLADFGIAVLNNAAQLTSKDSVLGSVHYLAPELVKGESASMQSDIYSLGIVMYEILTGDVPFKGDTPAAIALKHLKSNVPDVRKFNPDIPQSVANIVIKATARDPEERFTNAAEMLKSLLSCLQSEHANDATLVLKCSDLKDGNDISSFSDAHESRKEKRLEKQKKAEKRRSIFLISTITIISILSVLIFLFITGVIGHEKVTVTKVPDIINLTLAQGKDALDAEGLTVSYPYNYEYTENTREGLIADVSPSVGSEVDKGTKVVVTISRGTYEIMKDFVGKNFDEVKKSLIGTPISINVEYIQDEEKTPGEIVKQSISAGTSYNPGERIEITLTVIQPETVNIPTDLIGLNVNEVQYLLEDLGINVEIEQMDISNLSDAERATYKNYEVTNIDPKEGTVYEITSENKVVITYFYLETQGAAN